MFTSVAALIRASPVAASISPFTVTEPAVDATVNAPPLVPPVTTSPRALIATGAVPAIRTFPSATCIAPLVAARVRRPLFVTIDSFTFRSWPAVIVTAPPAAPPRPSTCAFTLMSSPAVTSRPAPVARFTIGWLMSTSPAARMLTGPAWPSMKESMATEPPVEAIASEPPVMS